LLIKFAKSFYFYALIDALNEIPFFQMREKTLKAMQNKNLSK